MTVTKKIAAQKIFAYLNHKLPLEKLVDWSEAAIMEGNLAEKDLDVLMAVLGQLGLADVRSGAVANRDTFEVCLSQGGVVELDASRTQNASSYVWTRFPPTGWSWITRFDTITSRLIFTKEGFYSIVLTTDNSCQQPQRDTLFFRVLPTLAIPSQNDTCREFTYRLARPVANATYERFFNGTTQGNFDPSVGFTASIGQHVVIARLGGNCVQEFRDTFEVQSAVPISFVLPTKDTIVCPKSGLIPLQVVGSVPTNTYVIKQGSNYFFSTNTAPLNSVQFIIARGTCGTGDTVVIRVRVRTPEINCNGTTHFTHDSA